MYSIILFKVIYFVVAIICRAGLKLLKGRPQVVWITGWINRRLLGTFLGNLSPIIITGCTEVASLSLLSAFFKGKSAFSMFSNMTARRFSSSCSFSFSLSFLSDPADSISSSSRSPHFIGQINFTSLLFR